MDNEEKKPKVYKHQRIDGSKDKKKRPKVYTCQKINRSEDEER